MTTAHSDILKQLDDPEPGSTWFVSLATMVIFVAIVVAASAFYFRIDEKEIDAKVVDQPSLDLEHLRAAQREELAVYSSYSWILPDGKSATFTRVPIDRAMELIVQEAKNAPRVLPATAKPAGAPATVQPGAQK